MLRFNKRQLITYTVVSQEIEGATDILAGLVPFFVPIIADMDGQAFDAKTFCQKIENEYDWPINIDVVDEIVPRLEAAGLLVAEQHLPDGILYKCNYTKSEHLKQNELNATKKLHLIAKEFMSFYDAVSPIFSLEHDIESLEEMLLNWIVSVEGYNRRSISEAVRKALQREAVDITLTNEVGDYNGDIFIPTNLNREESYICARFVQELERSNKEHFDYLVDIAAVALLTEVVLDIRNPADAQRKVQDLIIILDGPLLMDAIGLSGKEATKRVQDLLASLKTIGAQIATFDHCCTEIEQNLEAILRKPSYLRTGQTAEAIKKGEVSEDFAKSVRHDSAHFVREKEIQIISQTLAQTPSQHSYFPQETFEEFRDRLTWHDNPKAQIADAMSVALILRRRRGFGTRDPLKSRMLMISKNRLFCAFADRFCVEHQLKQNRNVGPLIHQRSMAAIIMLTLGNQERRAFSRRNVLGSCERVTQMRPRVVEKAMEAVRDVQPDLFEQFAALLSIPRSSQVLSDKTLNSPSSIDPSNILQIVEDMKSALKDDLRVEIDQEKDQLKEKHEREKTGYVEVINSFEQENEELREKIEKAVDMDQALLSSWITKARSWRRRLAYCERAGYIALLVLIFITTTLLTDSAPIKWIAGISTLLFGCLSLLKGFPNLLEKRIRKFSIAKLHGLASDANREDILTRYDVDIAAGTFSKKAKFGDKLL